MINKNKQLQGVPKWWLNAVSTLQKECAKRGLEMHMIADPNCAELSCGFKPQMELADLAGALAVLRRESGAEPTGRRYSTVTAMVKAEKILSGHPKLRKSLLRDLAKIEKTPKSRRSTNAC